MLNDSSARWRPRIWGTGEWKERVLAYKWLKMVMSDDDDSIQMRIRVAESCALTRDLNPEMGPQKSWLRHTRAYIWCIHSNTYRFEKIFKHLYLMFDQTLTRHILWLFNSHNIQNGRCHIGQRTRMISPTNLERVFLISCLSHDKRNMGSLSLVSTH